MSTPTKQQKAEAKRSRRASRNHCGQVCRPGADGRCCGPGGFSEYGHWNASLKAIERRASWRKPAVVCRDGFVGCDVPHSNGDNTHAFDPADTRTRSLPPKAAQALAMVAALAAPHGDHQGPVSGGDE